MDSTVALLVGLVVGVVVGAGLGVLLASVRTNKRDAVAGGVSAENPEVVAARHAAELSDLRAAEGAARAELQTAEAAARADLQSRLAAATATLESLREQAATQQEQYRELVERQRADARAQAQRDETEGRVLQALAPVKETITQMRVKVAELEQQRTRQHGELTEQLRAATAGEERLRRTAETLASALNSNNTRGVWGETQLRRVVEAAGLIDRVDFDVQASISSDAGAGRPDMIVHLPGGKSIAVDAKAPFTAYLEASAIPEGAEGPDAARRARLMEEHVKALRGHVTTLAGRSYWDGLEASPEFVVAFIPSESLVSAAMQADPSLMEFAFAKRVALASPVTLWSVLKSVAYTWQQEVLTADAKLLFDLSRELYGRIATMANHIDKLGRSLTAGVKDYNKFVGSLERQVLPSARKLAALDESKVLPSLAGVEETPRVLTAGELVADLAGDPPTVDAAVDDEAAGDAAVDDEAAGDAAVDHGAAGDAAVDHGAAGDAAVDHEAADHEASDDAAARGGLFGGLAQSSAVDA